MFVIDESFYSWMILILSIITSFVGLVPNIIDRYIYVQYENEGVIIARNRHPLTHSPWTVLYFLPLLYLSQKSHVPLFEGIISLFAISWVSHLLLDSLNPGGLPLGRQPVFSNHPIKHYMFNWTFPQKTRRLSIAKIPFNDSRANKNFGYIGIFIFSLNVTRMCLLLFWS
ncbi:MAG: hypothetical protein ACW98I_15300 [Candidatus Hodarchaeales archaeon]